MDFNSDIYSIAILPVNGHYQAYVNDQFICSGDTYSECKKELDEYLEKLHI